MATFCFSILCLSAFLSLRPEHLSVSAGPVPSSEVGAMATEDSKGWSTYQLASERKPTPKVNQNPRVGHHDQTTVLYDDDLTSRVKMDDIEKGMQPGMWGKRAKVGMGDAEGSKKDMMQWNGRKPEDLGTWEEKVHIRKLGAIAIGHLLQDEDWNEQLKLFSILQLLMNKEKCKEASYKKRAAKTLYAEAGKDSARRSASKTFLD